MPTLYVENVPEELYEALRMRAREHRKSISAEVLTLLGENVPTANELARRKEFLRLSHKLRARKPVSPGPFHSTEEVVRKDRKR
jgi:plasmid stability protein